MKETVRTNKLDLVSDLKILISLKGLMKIIDVNDMAKTITWNSQFILHASDTKEPTVDNAITPKIDVMEIEVRLDSLAVSILSTRWNNLPQLYVMMKT